MKIVAEMGCFSLLAVLCLSLAGCGEKESSRLPRSGFKVEFGEHAIPGEMTAGQTISAGITIKNASESTWPHKPNAKGRNAVNLSYYWRDRTGRVLEMDSLRTALPHDLGPGETIKLQAAIQAPGRSGQNMLEMTLVQEGVAWFPEMGGAILAVAVEVSKAPVETKGSTGREAKTPARGAGIDNPASPRSDKTGNVFPDKKIAAKLPEQKPDRAAARNEITKPEPAKQKNPWSIQIGSFAQEKDAERLARNLADKGYDAYVRVVKVNERIWHQVQVGRWANRAEAETFHATLRAAAGFKQSFIVNTQKTISQISLEAPK